MTTQKPKTRKEYLAERVREDCGKCSGTGTVSWGIDISAQIGDRHIPKVCFDCGGYGYTTVTRRTIEERARRERKAAEAAREAEARLRVKKAAWLEANADLADLLAPWADGTRQYPQGLIAHAITVVEGGWLSDADTAYVRKTLAEIAAKADVPTGKVTIEGTIGTIKMVDGYYGQTVKMRVVSPEGWAVWGTLPRALDAAEVGDTVRFTATVEASRDDAKFGFYKRPTKAEIIETATTTEEK